jgi:hypothetical protein
MKAIVFSERHGHELTFLIASHMGFLTREALEDGAATTLASLSAFDRHEPLVNEIGSEQSASVPQHGSTVQAVTRAKSI